MDLRRKKGDAELLEKLSKRKSEVAQEQQQQEAMNEVMRRLAAHGRPNRAQRRAAARANRKKLR